MSALPDGSIDFINQRWLEYLGLTMEEVRDWGWTAAIHPEDVERFVSEWRTAIAAGEPIEKETRFRRADGEYRRLLLRVNPVRDEEGRIVRWDGTRIDVEDRKQGEEKFKALLESAPDAMVIINEEGKIVIVNSQTEKIFGYGREELYGQTVEFLIPERFRGSHFGHRTDYIRTPKTRAMGAGLELYGLRKDGSEFPIDISLSPMKTEESVLVTAAIRDITERKKAEKALQESEARLEEAQRITHVGHWERDLDTDFITWSDETYRIFGLRPQARILSLTELAEAIHPEDKPIMVQAVTNSLRGGPRYDVEYRVVRPDGEVRHVHSQGDITRDKSGRPRRMFGTVQDITERKRTDEQLRKSEAYLSEAQRLSRTGSFGWNVSNRELFWSKETFCILGYDPGTKPTLERVFQRVHPEDLAIVQRTVDRASHDGTDVDFEHRLLMPDGSVKYLHVVAHAVGGESGDLEFVGAVSDVTARKAAEEKIRQNEREFRQIVEAIPGLILVLAPDGSALYANEMLLEYTGLTLEDVQAGNFRERVFHPDDVERLRDERLRALSRGVPFELEQRARGKDGQYRWFLIRFNPVRNELGHVIRWYATGTDIHDRKQTEDRIKKENVALREEIDKTSMFEEIVGTSAALEFVLNRVAKVAPTDSTVLITGETGTGKELIARAIHKRSPRSSRAFVSVNCAAIPPTLLASELFGHEKGAFTGALQRRLGRFELAEGGTIFLDEIGELTPETQIALLRVLQEREFERVGGNQAIRANVRVIAATNRDLKASIEAGDFRSDLFYRLNVFPVEVPPLRMRQDDIPLLVEYFVDRYASKAGKKFRSIDKKTLALLQSYPWPGNIRELQNVIERSVILSETENFSVDGSWLSRETFPISKASQQLSEKLITQEKEMIEAALTESRGRVSGLSGAAAKLGIPASTLESKIRSLKINKHRFKST